MAYNNIITSSYYLQLFGIIYKHIYIYRELIFHDILCANIY